MREAAALDLKRKKVIKPEYLFLYALMFLLYSPFAGIYSMSGMVGDTAIQLKLGLDDLAMGKLITDEIYSWHPDLVFTAHESGWYLLLGIMYKLFKLWGIIAIGTVFNYATGCTVLSYTKNKAPVFFIAFVMALSLLLNGYPDYNVRPSVASIFEITFLIVMFMNNWKSIHKAIAFAILGFFLAWLHGGMLPLFCVIMVVFIILELIYRNYRDAIVLAIGLIAGFVLSLLNPLGFGCYSYATLQSSATTAWAQIDEWHPVTLSLVQAVLIFLVFVGFMTNDRIKRFEKTAVTELLMLCMFFIIMCVYKRFMSLFSVCYLIVAPEQYYSLYKWIMNNVFKFKKEIKLHLSGMFYKVLAAACLLMIVVNGVLVVPAYLPTGTFYDVERMGAKDPEAAQFVLDHGYQRMFNTFNTGSWLVLRGVRVHIDNRVDPYISAFSGEDHISEFMNCSTIADMDVFAAKYDCDAFFLDMPDGYSYLLYEIERYAPDRYRIVYDNVVESSIPEVGRMRYVIIECISPD